MRTKRKNPQAMTYDQVESRKERGVEGLRRMGEASRAETLDDESVEDFAERKGITIVNPQKTNAGSNRKREYVVVMGHTVLKGSKKHEQLLQDKQRYDDLASSEQGRGRSNPGHQAVSSVLKRAGLTPASGRLRRAGYGVRKMKGAVGIIFDYSGGAGDSRTARRALESAGYRVEVKEDGQTLVARSTRKNPSEIEDAQAMFQKFHGRKSTTIEEVKARQNYRQTMSGLGVLMFLRTNMTQEWNGKGVGLTFSEEDKVIVASDPAGNQIYFLGGNQDVTGILPKRHAAAYKDFVDMGECDVIIYTADKDFDNFEEKDYQHEFGEETGERPRLMFDRLNQQLYLIGGAYEVKREGIVN